MRIIIKGTCRTCSRDEVREAVKFATKELLPKEVLKNLTITIILKKEVPFYAEMDETGTNRFTVWIQNKMTKKWVLVSIFHEMTHIKQFITGQMKDLNPEGTKVIWNSRILEYDDDDPLRRDYYRAPWEVEAYGREHTLWQLWKRRKAIAKAENQSSKPQA